MLPSGEQTKDIPPPSNKEFVIQDKINLVLEVGWLVILTVLHILRALFTSWFCPEKSLKGRVALVTGAGRGLGKGLAMGLAREGCKVAVADFNFANAEATAKEICDSGGKAKAYYTNVARVEEVRKLREAISKDFGPVDLLVNNAALIYFDTVEKYPEEAVTGIINVNLVSHFWMAQVFLPDMRERNSGHIVTINSTAAFVGHSNNAAYIACKFGLRGFMQSLRAELEEKPGNQIKTSSVFMYFTNTSSFYIDHWNVRLPPLSIDRVVEGTIAGIKREEVNITIPCILYYVLQLRFLLPQSIDDLISEVFYAQIRIPSQEVKDKLPQTAIIKDLTNKK